MSSREDAAESSISDQAGGEVHGGGGKGGAVEEADVDLGVTASSGTVIIISGAESGGTNDPFAIAGCCCGDSFPPTMAVAIGTEASQPTPAGP